MDMYKTASTLEGLFDLAKEDKLRIESVGHTSGYTKENEEYLLTVRIIRKTAERKEPAASADAEKTAQPKTAAGNETDKAGEKSGDKSGEDTREKTGDKSGDKTEEKSGDITRDKSGDKSGDKTGDKSGEDTREKTGERFGERFREKTGEKSAAEKLSSAAIIIP